MRGAKPVKYLLFVAFISLIALEGFLRLSVYVPINDGPLFYQTHWGYMMRGGVPVSGGDVTNTMGFRDIEHDPETAAKVSTSPG